MTLYQAARIVRRTGAEWFIRNRVDKLHVGAPDSEVERTLKTLSNKVKAAGLAQLKLDREVFRQAITCYGLMLHKRNRGLCGRVWSGRF